MPPTSSPPPSSPPPSLPQELEDAISALLNATELTREPTQELSFFSDVLALLDGPQDDATSAPPSLPPVVVTAVLDKVSSLTESLLASTSPSDGADDAAAKAENDMVLAVLTVEAELVRALLVAAETVEESTAIAATSALSSLVGGLQGRLGDVGDTDGAVGSTINATATASSVRSATSSLGVRAVEEMIKQAAGGGAGGPSAPPPPLTLRSANLNLTLAMSEPAALGDEPFSCDTASTPVEVTLPPGMMKLLSAAGQGTEDEPVGVVFTVTSLNLYGGTLTNLTTTGPLVSFSLRQAGAELKVSNLAQPINLTLPHTLADVRSRPSLASSTTGGTPYVCAGQPTQQEAAALLEQLLKTNDGSTASEVAELRAALSGAGCDEATECNNWRSSATTSVWRGDNSRPVTALGRLEHSTGAWSGDNCRTTGVSEAGVGCSCDHLTDFINVVLPTSWDEFAEYAVDGKPFARGPVSTSRR